MCVDRLPMAQQTGVPLILHGPYQQPLPVFLQTPNWYLSLDSMTNFPETTHLNPEDGGSMLLGSVSIRPRLHGVTIQNTVTLTASAVKVSNPTAH
jgi:hypothetical protein